MGQIVFNGQVPTCANLLAITTGEKANTILNENEIWLIDSTVASVSSTDVKSSTGTGRYDKYIKGDGQTAAKNLPLLNIDPHVPTHLSELSEDNNHKTVTAEQIARWNAGGGEGAATNVDNEDLYLAIQDETSVIKFKDKDYDNVNFSGYGKKYLRKNIVTASRKTSELIYDSIEADTQGDNYESDVIRNKGYAFNTRAAISEEDSIIGKTISRTVTTAFSIAYCRLDVHAGEIYKITAQKSDVANMGTKWLSRFWVVTTVPDENDQITILQAYKPNNDNLLNEIISEVDIIHIENDGVLWINYVKYQSGYCYIEKITETDESITINSITGITEPNTEYLVQYDYDLNGDILELPQNAILNFVGGSIRNGYIKGDNSIIIAPQDAAIISGGTLIGKWQNTNFYPKWFGTASDGVTDDTEVLQRMLDLSLYINAPVRLMWTGNTFKTTYGLLLKNNTHIYGGTINAQFDNPYDWVLQTNTIYTSGDLSAHVNYRYVSSWQEFDGKGTDFINHNTGSYINGLSIIAAEKNKKNMVIPEGSEEEEWDNTYLPIYGGLKLNGSDACTDNVTIRNTAIGLTRGACLRTYDNLLRIKTHFTAVEMKAINGHTIRDSYLNASTTISTYPYSLGYQANQHNVKLDSYIEGNGGIDDSDPEHARPKICALKLVYADSLILENAEVDTGCDVFLATSLGGVTCINPWLEAVKECYIWGKLSRVTFISPSVYGSIKAAYDIIGNQSVFTLITCEGRITCAGGTTGSEHKYSLESSKVYVANGKTSAYPDDDSFYFLTNEDTEGFSIVNASGETLNAQVNKCYNFSSAVNTLAVTLPVMENITTLKSLVLNIATGETPNITFTSADNKAIAYFENYEIESYSAYEINCLYNGTKWVIANIVVE